MTPKQIDATVADRLDRWGRFLRRQQATPMLIFAVRHPDGQPVIATVEGMPEELLRDALPAAVAALGEGRVDRA